MTHTSEIVTPGGRLVGVLIDAPVPGDHGAHGKFDAEATPFSLQVWVNLNRGKLGAALGLTATAAVAARRR